jgi:hypothetical protein
VRQSSTNNQILNLMKIRPVGAELFHADRRTGRHEEANIRFAIRRRRQKRFLEVSIGRFFNVFISNQKEKQSIS